MARSSRVRRGAVDTASRRLLDPVFEPLELDRPLVEVEDRRTSFPAVYRPAKRFVGYARLSMPAVVPPRSRRRFSHVVKFQDPSGVLICVRRKVRREVLHAKGRAGGRVRRPRRNEWSNISCRRR